MTPLKILLCVTDLERGGAEAQVVALACEMRRRGHTVAVVSMIPIQTEWAQLRASDIEVVSLGMRRGRPSLGAFLRFVRFWRSRPWDAVHAHMFHANILVRLARLFCPRSRVICTAHSIHEGGFWRVQAYRLTDALADMTTNVSQAAVAAYVDKRIAPAGRIAWVTNGIDMSKFAFPGNARAELRHRMQWTDGEFVWMAAGRLAEPKDYPTMLRAFASLKAAAITGWRLAIAGEGPLEKEITALIAELGLSRNVQLLGIRSDVPALLNAADGYVMSSAWEGLPLVLLEASAASLPVVATRVGGNAEAVVHGKSGLIVPAGSPSELAEAITELMQAAPESRARMGQYGRALVEANYDIRRVVDLWEQVYANPAAWLSQGHHRAVKP